MKFTSDIISSENTWQVGTGDDTRMYHDIFLKYGVALVGPGEPGREGDAETKLFYETNPKLKNYGAVLNQVKKDQWIIARKGKGVIIAIGQVIKEYNYSNLFDDVEGWDLQHFVKVKWYKPKTNDGLIQFSGLPLGQSTIQGCNNPVVYQEIYNREFEEIKNEFNPEDFFLPKSLSIESIIQAIIDKGIRIQDAENIGKTLQRIIRLTDWYVINDKETLEYQIVTFLTIPLLIALGWSEQKIKLEYNKIDIALFNSPFKGNYEMTPQIIVEVKRFSNGLAFTGDQVNKYASMFPKCKKFVATNGYIYKYFEKHNEKLKLIGYFNLLDLKERNILYDIPLTSIESILSISNFN